MNNKERPREPLAGGGKESTGHAFVWSTTLRDGRKNLQLLYTLRSERVHLKEGIRSGRRDHAERAEEEPFSGRSPRLRHDQKEEEKRTTPCSSPSECEIARREGSRR